MKTISTISDNIIRDLPGSIGPDREKFIVQTLQEFAIRTGIFKFTTEQSITQYDVDANANDSVALNPSGLGKYRPYRIESVFVDGNKKVTCSRNVLSDLSEFDLIYRNGLVYYTIDVKGRIILFPFPADTAFGTSSTDTLTVTIEAVYTVDESITEIDDFFYARWGKYIEAGATALLMAEPNKPWTNQRDADAYMKTFDQGVNSAKMKLNLEENGGELRVEKIPFI